jgi:hypothetical protein
LTGSFFIVSSVLVVIIPVNYIQDGSPGSGLVEKPDVWIFGSPVSAG